MFLRKVQRKNKDGSEREYLYVVRSVREGNRVYSKTVMSLGRCDEAETYEKLDEFIEALSKASKKIEVLSLERDMEPQACKEYGTVYVYRKLWERLGFGQMFAQYFSEKEARFDIGEAIFAMVVNRLTQPSSKREVSRWKEEVYEPKWDGLELQHFYRGMDYLAEEKSRFEEGLFVRTTDLFNQKLDLMMFDTTSISSWGEGQHSGLLKHGHSKAKRPDLKQIMVGVLMTKDGIPIGHEVWEGNQSDQESFRSIIDKVKKRFQIGRIIFVCDRGMISKRNIAYLQEHQYDYIIGARMRQFDEKKRAVILGKTGFKLVRKTAHETLRVKDILFTEENGQKVRYIACLNDAQAKIDAQNRAYFRDILNRKVAHSTAKEWIIKNGYKKYVNFEGENIHLVVNEKKFEQEAIYDGKWVLITNTQLPSQEIALYYKGLAQIERGFRDLKSEIETGPLYHWTSKRIRAHVFICFLALLLRQGLKTALYHPEKLVKQNSKQGVQLSLIPDNALPDAANYPPTPSSAKKETLPIFSEVLRALDQVKVMVFRIKNKTVFMRNDFSGNAYWALRAIGSVPPSKILNTLNL